MKQKTIWLMCLIIFGWLFVVSVDQVYGQGAEAAEADCGGDDDDDGDDGNPPPPGDDSGDYICPCCAAAGSMNLIRKEMEYALNEDELRADGGGEENYMCRHLTKTPYGYEDRREMSYSCIRCGGGFSAPRVTEIHIMPDMICGQGPKRKDNVRNYGLLQWQRSEIMIGIRRSDDILPMPRGPIGNECYRMGNGDVSVQSGGELIWGLVTKILVGTGQDGKPVGGLWMHASEPSVDLATPRSLNLGVYKAGEVEEIRDNADTNVLRQVMTPEGLSDIVPESSFKYSVKFYRPVDVEDDYDTNGYYVIKSGRTPYASWTFENPSGTTNDIDTLRVTRNSGGESVTNECEYIPGGVAQAIGWKLNKGGLQKKSMDVTTNATERILTREIRNGGDNLEGKTERHIHIYPWGEETVMKVTDPDGAGLTTTVGYYDDEGQTGKYSRVQARTYPDGSWDRFDYDEYGKRTEKVYTWKDSSTNASASEARSTVYEYAPVDENDQVTLCVLNPRTEIEKVEGKEVKRTYRAYYENAYGEQVEVEEQAYVAGTAYGNTNNLRLVRVVNPKSSSSAGSEKVKSMTYPDGRKDTFTYEFGDYTADTNNPGQSVFTASSTGTFIRVTCVHGTSANSDGVAYKTTKETRVENNLGQAVLEETYVYTGSAYDRTKWAVRSLDANGNPTHVYNSNGTESQATWGCCGKEYEKDENGVEYYYTYDALKRVTQKLKKGISAGTYPAQADQYTTYTYDAEGRKLTEVVSASGLSQGRTNQYDLAGRLTNSSDFTGLATITAYSQDGLTATETLSGGYTRITERHKDGQVKSITGTAQISQYYEYGVNEDGTKWAKVYSASNNSPVWVKTTTDLLDRTAKVEKPGYSGTETTEYFYNNKGQLVKTTTTGKPDTLYAYDEVGNQIQSGLDANANGVLDLAGTDRITGKENQYVQINNDWHLQTVNSLYATDNSADATTNSVTREKLTGLSGGTRSVVSVVDVNGNETITTTIVDPSNKKVTQTVDVPDSSSNVVTVAVNGLVQSQTSKTGLTTTYAYDSLGRRNSVTDARLGTAITHYESHGWVDYVEAGSRRTSYIYDSATGRKLSQTDHLSNTTYYAYTSYGQLEKTWGSGTYPVLYEYDGYGRMTKMNTYRGGTGWSSSTWPTSPGTADTTEWIYHEASGLLTAKKDAADKQVSYTYSSGGKLATRTWARVNGTNNLATSYSYNGAGDLSAIDYSDSTPDVSFTYDRLGRQKTADSSVSAHTFAYNGLLLDTETIISFAGTNVIDRSYDGYGRATGFTLGDDYSVTYGYDSLGRFTSESSASLAVNYSYLQNSDLISVISNGVLQTTRTYEQTRNLLAQIKNQIDSTTLSQFDYVNDNGGRRTSIKYSGIAFDTGASFNQYQYNDRSEVIVGDRFWGANINDTDNPVDGQGFAYAYDNIGNRTGASRGNKETTYTANNLNQYSERTVADLVDVIGSAETNTTVTVNDLATTRHGKYWHRGLGVTNDSSAVYQSVNVVGVYNPPDTNDPDIVSSVTGHVFVAKTPETFTYDDDGNLLSDGRFNYTWDNENRLIGAETLSNLPSSVPQVKLEFVYDYMSRRVSKQVSNIVSGQWTVVSSHAFVYDSWNLVREIAATPTPPYSVTNSYVWGLDLSGSLQGAGGIGGLLAAKLGTNNVVYSYDANGNVSELTDASTGSIRAHYEYSAYGEVLVSTGDLAKENSFRFSTKYTDDETGLVMYPYRPYSPGQGRFINKDPLWEIIFKQIGFNDAIAFHEGNLYGFVHNRPINFIDPVGFGDWPGTWDDGKVVNDPKSPGSVTVVDMDNGKVIVLKPGETTPKGDWDFAKLPDGSVVKVGPNEVTVGEDGKAKQTGTDLIPGNNPREATEAEKKDVENKIKNCK